MTFRISTGIDIVEIERIAHAIERWGDRFLGRVYTDSEQAVCKGRTESLAGRFAAKEAISKALGHGIGEVGWQDIEVLRDSRGKPQVILHGAARRIAESNGYDRFEISITHSRSHAAVIVIALGGEPA